MASEKKQRSRVSSCSACRSVAVLLVSFPSLFRTSSPCFSPVLGARMVGLFKGIIMLTEMDGTQPEGMEDAPQLPMTGDGVGPGNLKTFVVRLYCLSARLVAPPHSGRPYVKVVGSRPTPSAPSSPGAPCAGGPAVPVVMAAPPCAALVQTCRDSALGRTDLKKKSTVQHTGTGSTRGSRPSQLLRGEMER